MGNTTYHQHVVDDALLVPVVSLPGVLLDAFVVLTRVVG
jgi:hypothetical protein